MSHWDILGIAKTNDERAIRKAYAVILKTIDQELEPEKFIALREALEQAKNDAYYNSLEEAENNDDVFDNDTQPNLTQLVSVISETDNLQGTQDNIAHKIEDEIPLHQRGFEFLFNAIQQQDHNVDIRKELVDYIDYILNLSTDILPDEHAQFYLEQLNTACTEAGLNGLNDFLNLNKKASSAINDTEQPLNSPNNDTPQPSLKQQEQHYKEDLEQLCRTLWDENLDDHTFNQFSHMLVNWQQQTLEHQMQTYDQLSYVLGNIRDETEAPQRFFKQWYDYFGNDVPPASADHATHRLHERIEYILKTESFWEHTPKSYIEPLRQVQNYQKFNPLKMWKLLGSTHPCIKNLRKNNWSTIPQMVAPERNMNLHYLRILTNWNVFIPVQLLFSIMCIMIAGALFKIEAFTILTIWLPLSLLYFPIFIAFFLAKTFTSDDGFNVFLRLTTICYLSLIILGLVSPMINNTVMPILLCVWLVLATFVMSYAFYTSPSIFSYLPDAIRIQADKFFTWVGLGLVSALVGFIVFINTSQVITPFNLFFVLLPVLLILLPNYFKEFFTHFFKAPSQVIINLIKPLQSSSFSMVFGIFVLYSALSLMAGSANAKSLQDYINLPLALTLIGCFWLAFIPSKIVAYICKYAVYFGILISSIVGLASGMAPITIITVWVGYYLSHTLLQDLKLRKFIKEQQGKS